MVLEDQYKIYLNSANLYLPHWESMDRNLLCDYYVKLEDKQSQIAEGYLGAIFLKYWPNIGRYYSYCHGYATFEECYDWLSDSILYALNNPFWTYEDSKLYLNPKGPDIMINQNMNNNRLNFYQGRNYDKRKINSTAVSLDALVEALGDASDAYQIKDPDGGDYLISLIIKESWEKENYLCSFLVYDISYNDSVRWSHKKGSNYFSSSKFVSNLKNSTKTDQKLFALRYDLDPIEVEEKIEELKSIADSQLLVQSIVALDKLKREYFA